MMVSTSTEIISIARGTEEKGMDGYPPPQGDGGGKWKRRGGMSISSSALAVVW